MKVLRAALSITLLSAFCTTARAQSQLALLHLSTPPARTLFAQSAAQILETEFRSRNVSFLLLDAQSGALLASRWPGADRPIPLGSLVKPFTALAYAQHHQYRYPTYICYGKVSGCWQPRPHGRLNISAALAYSCNSYFRDLTATLTGNQIQNVAAQFDLEPPDPRLTGPSLMGLGEQWLISPLRMARAYVELIRRRDQPGVSEILAGLADSAEWGTGSGVARVLKHSGLFAKTGTAVCVHTPRATGDGFVIVVTPSDQPQLLLMVRVHGVPGSEAALAAGRMLARLEP
jgi:cell division protein FtsI/penicillin-binding protein 2